METPEEQQAEIQTRDAIIQTEREYKSTDRDHRTANPVCQPGVAWSVPRATRS